MFYQTTITKKGQITIPKAVRIGLNLRPSQRVLIDFEEKSKLAKIEPAEDFLSVAKRIKVKNKTDVLKAREYFEENYGRP